MTSTDALQKLVAFDPTRSWFAKKEVSSTTIRRHESSKVEYTISAIPGIRGKDCSIWYSETGFDQPVTDAIQALTPAAKVTDIQPNHE